MKKERNQKGTINYLHKKKKELYGICYIVIIFDKMLRK